VLPGRGAETSLKEVNVPSHSPLIGLTIAAVERDNARWRVVGLKRGADPTSIIPDLQTAIVTGGPIVVIGARQRLAHLAQSAT
jgi:Trk K+ transport system NAD-binding subunit